VYFRIFFDEKTASGLKLQVRFRGSFTRWCTPAHDALDCAIARRMERYPPSGWKRPPGRPRRTWTQHIGNGSTSSVHREWTHATALGHATRSALRVSATQAIWRKYLYLISLYVEYRYKDIFDLKLWP